MNTNPFPFNSVLDQMFYDILRNVKTDYKPPKYSCTICGTLMSPVAPGVLQFAYQKVKRKEWWTMERTGLVCCELCATDYEFKHLPKRFPILDQGYVYLMRAEWGYKIGESEDPEYRRKQLQSKYKKPIELLHTIKAPHAIGAEKFLQYRYQNLQIDRGNGEREWFNLSEKEIKYIKSFTLIEAWRPYGKTDTVIVKLSWKS